MAGWTFFGMTPQQMAPSPSPSFNLSAGQVAPSGGSLPGLPGGLPGSPLPKLPQAGTPPPPQPLGGPIPNGSAGAGTENAAVNQPTPGVSNQQQMQNFLQALHTMYPQGASNNGFMNPAPQPPGPTTQPLVPPGAYVNGSAPYNTTLPSQQVQAPSNQVNQWNGNQVQQGLNQLPNSFNGWSGLPTLSDETQKQQIKDNKPSLDKFMSEVGTWQYEYKHPELDGKGTFYGPMAQELEKTEVGKSAVLNTPRGKMVDTGRLSLINTSALSLLNKQQDRMQQQIDLLKKQLRLKHG